MSLVKEIATTRATICIAIIIRFTPLSSNNKKIVGMAAFVIILAAYQELHKEKNIQLVLCISFFLSSHDANNLKLCNLLYNKAVSVKNIMYSS